MKKIQFTSVLASGIYPRNQFTASEPYTMRTTEDNLDDACVTQLGDDLDINVTDFIANQEKEGSQKGAGQINVRRRLEQLREERELAYHLKSDFDF